MKNLLQTLALLFTILAMIGGLSAFLLTFGITNNIRPGVRIWSDLRGNALNALFSKKYLTDQGVEIRYYLFMCILAFVACGAIATALGGIAQLL
jgi:hypothetical protein